MRRINRLATGGALSICARASKPFTRDTRGETHLDHARTWGAQLPRAPWDCPFRPFAPGGPCYVVID